MGNVRRLVVKLGTGVLTDSKKQLDLAQMEQLAVQIAAQRHAGREVLVVSSGAVGAGMGVLGYAKRPSVLAQLQACAAVGQVRLMATYEKLFSQLGFPVAQVLLTHDDLQNHERHLNARNTLLRLLRDGVIPIINENDVVSFTELKFGDNDKLSALVACLLPADLLAILTTVDGLIANLGESNERIVPVVERIDATVEKLAGGTLSSTAVGGMIAKIQAAKIATRAGIPLAIAPGRKADVLARLLNGEAEGTWFAPQSGKLPGRKRWIAFFHQPKGALYVDAGAKRALSDGGKSLLLPGIAKCEGEFVQDEIVRIRDLHGTEFARGITRFDSASIRAKRLTQPVVVHRDDLVIL